MKSYSKQIVTKEDNKSLVTLIWVSLALHVVTVASLLALAVKIFQ